MISIVVPVYNVEKSVARCIDSIIAQKYADWELILVDDGSPDRSGEICDEYALKDNRIRVIHQENQGVSSARNHGIELAVGEYITFVDSDDYLDAVFLSSFELENGADLQVQGMISTYPDKADIVHLPVAAKDRNIGVVEALSCAENVKFLFSPWAKLFKTSILKKHNILFPTEICYTEDEVFVKRFLTHATSVRVIDEAYYFYTHESSAPLSGRDYSSEELYQCLTVEHQAHNEMVSALCEVPPGYLDVYIRRKSYLVYRLLHKISHEEDADQDRILKLVAELKQEYSQQLRYLGDLPRTYRLMRAMVLFLPTRVALWGIRRITIR